MLQAYKVKLVDPNAGQFGYKHLLGVVKYCKIYSEDKPLSFFLGTNVWGKKFIWKDFATQDNLPVHTKIEEIPLSNDDPIDTLGIEFESWGAIWGQGTKTKSVEVSYCLNSTNDVVPHLVLPIDIDSDLFLKEINDSCLINSSTEMDELFSFVSNHRFGSDNFSNLRKVFKDVINKPIRSSSAYEDAKEDFWDDLIKQHSSVNVSNILTLSNEETVAWFKSKHAIAFVHEKQLLNSGLPKKNSIADYEDIVIGELDPDYDVWDTIELKLGRLSTNIKIFEDTGTFDAIIPLKVTGGYSNFSAGDSSQVLEKLKPSVRHTTASNTIGSIYSIPLETLDFFIETFVRESDGNLFAGYLANIPKNDYSDSIEQSVKIDYGFKTLSNILYSTNYTGKVPVTIIDLKKIEKYIDEALAIIGTPEQKDILKKLKSSSVGLKEEKLSRLTEKMEMLYYYVEPYIGEYLKYQLDYPKVDRAYFISDSTINYRRSSTENKRRSFAHHRLVKAYYNSVPSQHFDMGPSVTDFSWFLSMLKKDNIEEYRPLLSKVMSEYMPTIVRTDTTPDLKAIQKDLFKLAASKQEEFPVKWGELENIHSAISTKMMVNLMVYTKINLSVEDATFLNFDYKGTFLRPRDIMEDWLESHGTKNIVLVSSIYA
jgi:hypothetical protein